ncbi:MAG TPA: tail protein X [Sphingomonas sp.]|jgi:phage tail protein X|uniref:tail protein X n=1 Tax=Sphingomonas sp. TaxID=28214 RepID=UPI002ED82B0F
MADDILHARQGDTLDELAWRERGLGPADLPALLDANAGVAGLGAVLPIGTAIRVPLSAPTTATRAVVNLWD